MNRTAAQKGEGIEYFILLFGLAIILMITGGRRASIDSSLIKNEDRPAAGGNYNQVAKAV